MVGYLKSLQVLKWGNLDLSCITRKVTVSDSKYAKLVKLIISCKIVPLSPLNHICDSLNARNRKICGARSKNPPGVFTAPPGLSATVVLILRMSAFIAKLNLYPQNGHC